MIDAFKRASACASRLCCPLTATLGRTRKDQPRVPIRREIIADLLETARRQSALTLDLHAPQIRLFRRSGRSPLCSPVLIEHFRHLQSAELDCRFADAAASNAPAPSQSGLDAPLAIEISAESIN